MPPRSPGRRLPAPDNTALSVNVRQTAGTVVTVLDSFAESLRRAGFESGLEAYRQMANTMVNQRLWAINHGDHGAEASFERIATQASRIAALLREFVSVMERLSSLSAIRESLAPAPADLPETDRTVVTWLAGQSGGASATQIRAGTRLASSDLIPILTRLEAGGLVRKGGSAGRQIYTLVR
jgi:uncharacterized membrane protein